MTDEAQSAHKTIGALADFAEDRNLIAEIETIDGMTYEIPIRKLSLDEWSGVGRDVPEPARRQVGAKADGTILYNDNDPDYLEEVAEANITRQFYRILACVRFDVPGKTKASQVAALRDQLPSDVAQALGVYLVQLHNRWRRTVEARAESFHELRPGAPAGDTEDRAASVADAE